MGNGLEKVVTTLMELVQKPYGKAGSMFPLRSGQQRITTTSSSASWNLNLALLLAEMGVSALN